MRYALIGHGKMGRAVDAIASARDHERVAIATKGPPWNAAVARADVAFEFTTPSSALENVAALLALGIPVVCGTTAWDPDDARIARALRAARAGLVVAPNFSIGMGLFFRITAAATRILAAVRLYDAYVLELHHRAKADAPSGTALRLAAIVQEGDERARTIQAGALRGRLPEGAVHVVGVRAGHEAGTHTVGFDGEHDSIALTHRARGRSAAALGAVLAGEWIRKRPGRHSFDEVLDDLVATQLGTRRQPRRANAAKRERKR